MTIAIAILALTIFLSGAVLGVLALLAVGIWTGSRGRPVPPGSAQLASKPSPTGLVGRRRPLEPQAEDES